MRNGFVGAGHIAIPCAAETCSYKAPNAKSETWNEVSPPEIYQRQKLVSRSKASKPSGAIINLSRNQGS